MTRWRVAALIALATGVPALTVAAVLADLSPAQRSALLDTLGGQAVVLALGLVLLVAGIGWVAWGTRRAELRADARQAADIDVIATANPDHRLAGETAVQRSVNALAARHASAEQRMSERLAAASAELRAERDTLFAVLRDLDVPVAVADADGRLLLVNPAARAALVSRTPLVAGRSIFGVLDADDLRPLLARAIAGERPRAVVAGTTVRLARITGADDPALVLVLGEPGVTAAGPTLGLSVDLAPRPRGPVPRQEWPGTALTELSFTVLDCETTGLHVDAGDRLISLAAVRVSRGRVRADDTFDALVDPGRHIPEASIEFHGITDELVADAPSGADVLTAFAAHAEDSVLVGHHLGFDLGFLAGPARAAGVALEPLGLDTLLLSAVLDPHPETRHGLDAVAARLGVEVVGRHTALGDALATAEILVRMLPLLAERGIRTLGQARDACARTELAARIDAAGGATHPALTIGRPDVAL